MKLGRVSAACAGRGGCEGRSSEACVRKRRERGGGEGRDDVRDCPRHNRISQPRTNSPKATPPLPWYPSTPSTPPARKKQGHRPLPPFQNRGMVPASRRRWPIPAIKSITGAPSASQTQNERPYMRGGQRQNVRGLPTPPIPPLSCLHTFLSCAVWMSSGDGPTGSSLEASPSGQYLRMIRFCPLCACMYPNSYAAG